MAKIKIREIRRGKDITQKELSKYIGVAQNTLSQWELGNYEPPYHILLKLADYFNVSTDYLLGRDETNTA